MRESRRLERTQLPADAFEQWVKDQHVKPAGTGRHEKALEDCYETWVRHRVEARRRRVEPRALRTT